MNVLAIMVSVVKAVVRAILFYGVPVWAPPKKACFSKMDEMVVAPVNVFTPEMVQVPASSLVSPPVVVPKILDNVPPDAPPMVNPKVAPVMIPVLLIFILPDPPTMLLALPNVIKPP